MPLFPIVLGDEKSKIKETECLEAGNSVSTPKMNSESPEIIKSALH